MNPHNRCPDLSRVLPVETVHVIRPEMISPLAREQSERFRQTQNKALESNATTRVQSSISSAKITDVEDEEIGEEADEENISSLVLPSLSSVLGPLALRPSKTPTSGIQSPTSLRSSAVPYLIDDSARWGCPICGKDFASRNYTAQHLESACQTMSLRGLFISELAANDRRAALQK
ncbi:hypothetical protein ACEPPN_007235 [Leptodophora sp. 'Broadleaf-Isolate-01']